MIKKQVVVDVKYNGVDELDASLNKVEGSLKDVKKEADVTSSGLKEVGDNGGAIAILDSFTGGLATKMRDAGEATKLFNFSLKGTSKALIATGIGAFVVALGLVVAYWDDIRDAITGANTELEIQKQLTIDINNELERRNFINNLDLRQQRIKEELEIKKAKIAGGSEKDITEIKRKGYVDRIAIAKKEAEESDKVLKDSADADQETFQRALDAQEAAYKQLGISRGELSSFDLDQKLPKTSKTTSRETKVDEAKMLNEEIQAVNDQFFNSLLSNNEREIEAINDKYVTLIENAKKFGIDTAELEENYATELSIARTKHKTEFEDEQEQDRLDKKAKEKQDKQDSYDLTQADRDAKVDAYYAISDAMGSVSSLLGESTDAGKAAALSSALINTYLGISNVWAEKSESDLVGAGLVQRIATTAIVAASGFANIRKIMAVQTPNGGGGGAGGGGSYSVPNAGPQFNVVGTSGTNQLAQSLGNQEPIKAYVVSTDMTTQQEFDRNIEESAAFGS